MFENRFRLLTLKMGFLLLLTSLMGNRWYIHDDVIKWTHFPRYWLFVREIHRSPVNSSQKGQWLGALMFPLICAWINGWANSREAGDLRHYLAGPLGHHCNNFITTAPYKGALVKVWLIVFEKCIYRLYMTCKNEVINLCTLTCEIMWHRN